MNESESMCTHFGSALFKQDAFLFFFVVQDIVHPLHGKAVFFQIRFDAFLEHLRGFPHEEQLLATVLLDVLLGSWIDQGRLDLWRASMEGLNRLQTPAGNDGHGLLPSPPITHR